MLPTKHHFFPDEHLERTMLFLSSGGGGSGGGGSGDCGCGIDGDLGIHKEWPGRGGCSISHSVGKPSYK
jgi:hypothetical protein